MFAWGLDSVLSGKFFKLLKTEGLIKTIERGKGMKFRNIHDNAGSRGVVDMVGMDVHGNRYYEDIYGNDSNDAYMSTRWVEYSDRFEWFMSGRKIPPEWHGWLHRVYDDAPKPGNNHFTNPLYKIRHEPNKSGLADSHWPLGYHPQIGYNKQFAANAKARVYTKWVPEETQKVERYD
jgi:NADH:ubiquinone oxidoreductase subunit